MVATRKTKAWLTWITCAAILLVALMPSISQAVKRTGSNPWTEICTSWGAKRVAVGDTAANTSAPSVPVEHLLQHCPYCTVHATVLGMPPAPLSVAPPHALRFALPALFLASPRTLFAWSSAQPRAPPRLS
jgi:hypothetical protein